MQIPISDSLPNCLTTRHFFSSQGLGHNRFAFAKLFVNMSVLKLVVTFFLVIAVLSCASAIPQPGVVREKYIIHAPIKFKTIHHHKIRKIPVLIKKHVYFYKNSEDVQPIGKEDFGNLIENDFTEYKVQSVQNPKFNHLGKDSGLGKYNGHSEYNEYNGEITNQQEDYESSKQSEEEDYDDYEYE